MKTYQVKIAICIISILKLFVDLADIQRAAGGHRDNRNIV